MSGGARIKTSFVRSHDDVNCIEVEYILWENNVEIVKYRLCVWCYALTATANSACSCQSVNTIKPPATNPQASVNIRVFSPGWFALFRKSQQFPRIYLYTTCYFTMLYKSRCPYLSRMIGRNCSRQRAKYCIMGYNYHPPSRTKYTW